MGDESLENLPYRKDRRAGVWLLTILNGFGHGLVPLGALVWAIVSVKADFPMFQTLLTAAILIAIIGSSIGTWAGENFFRRTLLAALGIQFVTFLIYTFDGFDWKEMSRRDVWDIGLRTVRSGVWLTVNVWYFTRPKVMAFYQ